MIIFLRKNGRRLSFFMILALCLGMLFGTDMIYGDEPSEEAFGMYSGSYALTDADTGRLLRGKKEKEPMANASTTKILTCIVTLENGNIGDSVTISANAAAQPKVRLGVKEGEQYPLRDLLYALMLESFNDCAVAIAEHVGGSVEEFCRMMNDKAKELGCTDTYFLTPNGLDVTVDGQSHHTTAADLCRIMAYCVWESPQKDTFLAITQARNYSGSANGRNYSFVNHNSFLDQMDGVLSGKTGFTSKAGYCYVAALEQDGERYCIALLACGWPNNKNYKWKDASKLLNYGLERYENRIMEAEKVSRIVSVEGCVGEESFRNLNRSMELTISGTYMEREVLLGENEAVQRELVMYDAAVLPIEKGKVMGRCNLYLDDILLDSTPLEAEESVGEWSLSRIMRMIFRQFLIFSSQSGL